MRCDAMSSDLRLGLLVFWSWDWDRDRDRDRDWLIDWGWRG
jgi:hypothetical protein